MTDPLPLRLRAYGPENADTVLYWRNQPRVLANMSNDQPISPAEHAAFLDGLQDDASREYFLLERGPQVLAGLSLVDINQPVVRWGCFLCSEGVVPGLFPALFLLAADRAFDRHGAPCLGSEVVEHNQAPQHLNRYLGMPISARRRIQRPVSGPCELLEYRLNVKDWSPVRARSATLLSRALHEAINSVEITETP